MVGPQPSLLGMRLMMNFTVSLFGHFAVWLSSKEAEWIKSKMIWCNWDVDEVLAKKEQILKDPAYLNIGMNGWPYVA
jgi:hypothetical protein